MALPKVSWLGLLAIGAACPAAAQDSPPPPAPAHTEMQVSAAQLFGLADAARDRGDYRTAETAYRALSNDPDIEFRTEARFRLAMMLADREKRYRDAAVELRRILDEKPGAARVRLELARMDAMIGDLGAARRELRAARASSLPPEVDQLVRFYANALTARKKVGGSFELAVAPDSNINRATHANTLSTVIGDFVLDNDARARSGIGLATRAQAYARIGIDHRSRLLLQASGSGNIYRDPAFDDIAFTVQAGPEVTSGADRIGLSGGPSWRWYGNKPYSLSYGVSGNILHPTGKRSQLRIDAGIVHTDNRRNALQSGDGFSLSLGMDRAFSPRFGGGFQISGVRDTAADPGYADANGGVNGYLFREFGRTTAVIGVSYSHLEADARLFLYPERRRDDRFGASASATFRSLTLGTFAPFARLRAERNKSTVGIYDFSRLAGEAGLTSAF